MAELDGIVDEVVENLLNLSKVRIHQSDIFGKCQVQDNIFSITGSLKGGGRVLDHPVHVKIGPGQIAFAV